MVSKLTRKNQQKNSPNVIPMKIYMTEIHHGSLTRRKPIFSVRSHGNLIATGSIDGELRIWKNLSPFQMLQCHVGTVMCICFSPNGRILVSAGDDGNICVYKKNVFFELLKTVRAHASDITALVFKDHLLISGGLDGNVCFFECKMFEKTRTIKVEPVKGIALSPDGQVLAVQTEAKLYMYENYSLSKTIDCIFDGQISECFFSRLSWSPDSMYLAVGLSFNSYENSVEIINRKYESAYSLIGHVAPVEVVAFAPNIYQQDNVSYYVVATASQDKSICLWSSQNTRPPLLLKNFSDQPILDLCWNKSSLIAVSYDGFLRIIEFGGDLGDIGGKIVNEEVQIPFSLLNIDFSKFKEDYLKGIHDQLSVDMCTNKISIQAASPKVNVSKKTGNHKNEIEKTRAKNEIIETQIVKNIDKRIGIQEGSTGLADVKNNYLPEQEIKNKEFIETDSLPDNKNMDIGKLNGKSKTSPKGENLNPQLSPQKNFIENSPPKKVKKKIKPFLLENSENNEIVETEKNSYFAIFKSAPKGVNYLKPQEFSKTIGEFKIEIYGSADLVRVYRDTKQLYHIKCRGVASFCASREFLVVNSVQENISEIYIYELESGALVLPTICLSTIVAIDIRSPCLLLVDANRQFRVIDLRKKQTKVADFILDGTLLNIYLDKRLFLVSVYERNTFFYCKKLKTWINKDRIFDSRFTEEIDFEESAETNEFANCDIADLEHKFQVAHLISDVDAMLRVTKKMVKIAAKSDFTEIDEYKYEHIFDTLVSLGLKREVVIFLEELNCNCKIQPFVCHLIRKINGID